MRAYLRRAFECDVRSLAVFRIALGLLLVADIAWRLPWFDAWLTEAGAWPMVAIHSENPRAWSLYFLSPSPGWTITLLTCATAFALALAIGWRTRAATIVSWILLVSLQTRNELPLNAGDIVLRLLLFWGAFLPLGAAWSVDARRRPAGGAVVSTGTVALLIQVALIYVFNALYKTGADWKSGAAIATVLQQETYTTGLAPLLLQWPRLLEFATRATWWFELLGPAMAFLPWRTRLMRGLVAFGFIGFHLVLLATLRIGLFPVICMVAWLPFLPGGFWDRIGWRARSGDSPVRNRTLETIAACALALVLASNVMRYAGMKRPAWMRSPANLLRLDQQWSLFAPDPSRAEGWMVVVIESSDGRKYDSFTGAEVDWGRPPHLGDVLPSGQWRKFLAAVRNAKHRHRVQLFARWRAAQWEMNHPGQKVLRTRVHYLWEWLEKRQDPPDHWLVFEHPTGPLTDQARKAGSPVPPPSGEPDL